MKWLALEPFSAHPEAILAHRRAFHARARLCGDFVAAGLSVVRLSPE
jgi:hypothetical protein